MIFSSIRFISICLYIYYDFKIMRILYIERKQLKCMECILQNTCCPSGHQRKLLLFNHSAVSNSLWPHGLQHVRLPYPSPSPGACSNSCPLNQWCHPTILYSVISFSFCLLFIPASASFLMRRLFASGGQSIGASASASVLPISIQDWFALGLTDLISLQSTGLSRVFSDTTVQKH